MCYTNVIGKAEKQKLFSLGKNLAVHFIDLQWKHFFSLLEALWLVLIKVVGWEGRDEIASG